ncbi:hypothetical protein [Amycolatopsis coloradensis]|uniref:hypothetical protein n=1 Tax=Amycolatopsis coloradensis TaxID=76021 RepID=UPI00117788B0|nr:hypothetical protein [Amycolatopsis coloradensis]
MSSDGLTDFEIRQLGRLVDAKVAAVFRWGVIVDINLSRPGLIDALYVDDSDSYVVDDVVRVYLDSYDRQKDKIIARPPHQVPLLDRLREKGFDL